MSISVCKTTELYFSFLFRLTQVHKKCLDEIQGFVLASLFLNILERSLKNLF
mgnify:CR=1 FL=1